MSTISQPPAGEDALDALLDQVRADPARRDELVALLREDAPIYAGRGASSSARLRGWIMATFEDVGLPAAGLPFVLEDLESDLDPYGVAAAARALRGLDAPTPAVASALVDALERMRARDDAVTFESLRPAWPASRPTTALTEVLRTIRRLGDAAAGERGRLEELRAEHGATWSTAVRRELDAAIEELPSSCCGGHPVEVQDAPAAGCCEATVGDDVDDTGDIGDLLLEDQDGERRTFAQRFAGRTTVVAFFYTRCPNPNKCSLTVTKLGALQRLVTDAGLADRVRIAAVTYDPGYDHPARLRAYGTSRGLRFDGTAVALRAVDEHERLQRHFALRVGYVRSLVNRHAIELFLLDGDGRVVDTWVRRQWDVAEVVERVAAASGGPGGGTGPAVH